MSNSVRRILTLAANPKKTGRLRLDEEVREIDKALRRAQKRDHFELKSRWAVTPRDLQLAILEEKPEIIHFCGHGEKDGLVLEDDLGQATLVSTAALSNLFKLFAGQVQCVLLNACYSEVQAKEICQHIGYVIGMNQPIGDRAAIEFAFGFYSALGSDRAYDFAYQFGCNSIDMAGIPEADIPVLKQRSLRITPRESSPSNPPSLWIHGLLKRKYGNSPTVELDWMRYFLPEGHRQNPDESIWKDRLFPDLIQAKQFLANLHSGECIDLRATLPLPAMLAVGAAFPELAYRLQYEQNTRGQTSLWQSYIVPSMLKFRVVEEKTGSGTQLLIAFGITDNAQKDVENLFQKSPESFSALVYAEPELGVGDAAIFNADAVALAIHAKELMREYRQKYDAKLIHLIMMAPAGFALFLGQKLNALGEVVSYEWTSAEGYQPAVRCSIGF
jgi:hypothetical protein